MLTPVIYMPQLSLYFLISPVEPTTSCGLTLSSNIQSTLRYNIPFIITNNVPSLPSGSNVSSLAIFQYLSSVLSSICIFKTSAEGHNYGLRIGYTRITVYSGFNNTRYKI